MYIRDLFSKFNLAFLLNLNTKLHLQTSLCHKASTQSYTHAHLHAASQRPSSCRDRDQACSWQGWLLHAVYRCDARSIQVLYRVERLHQEWSWRGGVGDVESATDEVLEWVAGVEEG